MSSMLRDRTAIAGVGSTGYSRNFGVSTQTLALRAIADALEDAGLGVDDVDGVACHRVNDSIPASQISHALGIQDLRYHLDLFGGGSVSASVVGSAAMAVATGVAEVVVCWRAVNARSETRMGGTGRAAPPGVEFQYQAPYGYLTPPQQFAMASRAYLDAFEVTPEQTGTIAVTQRRFAVDNERAIMREPIDMDAYLASRMIAEPLRLLDCCLETDAAVAIVVTSAERARHLAKTPVLISGAVFGSGHTLYSNDRGDLTRTAAADASRRLYEMAGVGPSEVDVAELYDAFTPLVLLQLEDYGFCAKGDAGAFVEDGSTGPGGAIPVNTHGGHLSEGYAHGLNHVLEAVEQLRGSSGRRQVEGAEVALSTGQPGYVAGTTSALLLRSDP